MCGRFTLATTDYREMAEALGVTPRDEDAAEHKPRWNIAPTDLHWILRLSPDEGRRLFRARWGLVNHWAKDAKRAGQQINARSDGVATRPAYRDAFVRRRCAVPADGWFEWVGAAKKKQPIWFHRPDDSLLLFAGLFEKWNDPATGIVVPTFTILTTDARGRPANFHDRMPVVLRPERVDTWIAPEPATGDPEEFIRSVEVREVDEFVLGTEVSPRVNSVKNDDPTCLDPPPPPERPHGQGSLF